MGLTNAANQDKRNYALSKAVFFTPSPLKGPATIVWCAISPHLKGPGGVYCQDCDVAPVRPEPVEGVVDLTSEAAKKFASRPLGVMPYAVEPKVARVVGFK